MVWIFRFLTFFRVEWCIYHPNRSLGGPNPSILRNHKNRQVIFDGACSSPASHKKTMSRSLKSSSPATIAYGLFMGRDVELFEVSSRRPGALRTTRWATAPSVTAAGPASQRREAEAEPRGSARGGGRGPQRFASPLWRHPGP